MPVCWDQAQARLVDRMVAAGAHRGGVGGVGLARRGVVALDSCLQLGPQLLRQLPRHVLPASCPCTRAHQIISRKLVIFHNSLHGCLSS